MILSNTMHTFRAQPHPKCVRHNTPDDMRPPVLRDSLQRWHPFSSSISRRRSHNSIITCNRLTTTTKKDDEEDKRFKILFLGRDEFSCLVLKELHGARALWKEISIVTQPDDVQVGRRGERVSVSPLKTLALELKHPVHHIPASKADFKTWEPPEPFRTCSTPPLSQEHVLITASFGRILRASTLSLFRPGRKLNVHPSLLPKYRGAAPIQWTVLNGDDEAGVCVIEMLGRSEGEGVDGGGVWGATRVTTPDRPDFEGLRNELGVLGGKLLVSTLREMLDGKATPRPQPSGDRTPAPRITAEHAAIDFQTTSAGQIDRTHRAIGHQRPLTTTYLSSSSSTTPSWNTIQLLDISPLPVTTTTTTTSPGRFAYCKSKKTLFVGCAEEGSSAIEVKKVKPENGKEMTAEAFWNGVAAKVARAERKGEKAPDGLMVFGGVRS